MMPFEIIPTERDAKAKRVYLFWRWWIRKHRKWLEEKHRAFLEQYILYGFNIQDKE